MEKAKNVQIRPPQTEEDREWFRSLWISEWGGEIMISRGRAYGPQDVSALIAWEDGMRVGAASYLLDRDECELTSLNATVIGAGIGSRLIAAAEEAVRQAGVHRLWLLTTNDNIDALRFYQRRGYRIAAIYPDAIAESRKLKPTIPLVGYYDIPIRDEIVLEKQL
ncbi:GNAT family N-acetyltransferase [Paenibacillus rhizovicinus]|uniref:GNAT family N-acetyltransferase n=1 Tax=Paenibacillus rhizovicinus TaxID=2704463 RepID=A0A6C0P5S4_9BACL|nr:GNAT family N-acetyltransferase [Paenibacillus rhizovicinus]QHW33701.1 GNAT family N-acetyltransferase [Paenibacillus rhizovicinus]